MMITYFWIMYESPSFAVWGKISSRGIFETFDDSLGI